MRALSIALGESRPLLLAQIAQFTAVVEALDELALLDPARCRGWSRLEVIVHVRLGLAEMAAAVAAFTDRAPDHDAASYRGSHPDDRDDDPVAHILWLRRTASAYGRPAGAVHHLRVVATRASHVVAQASGRPILFQDKAMSIGDFVATWVVELAAHQLDLDLEGTPVGAGLARRTLAALAGAALPEQLDDAEAVLAGLGRIPWPAHLGDPGPFPISL